MVPVLGARFPSRWTDFPLDSISSWSWKKKSIARQKTSGVGHAVLLVDLSSKQKVVTRPNKKRSLLWLTRPTVFWSADRTLFSDFASDTFCRRSVRGQLRRRSRSWEASGESTSKNQAKGRLLCRDPSAHRDVRRYNSIDATRFLSAAANRASFSLLATCCFNFETWHVGLFLFFWPIRSRPANQLFLVYGDASCCQLPRGQEAFLQRTSSARGRGCRVALGVAGCAWR